MKMKMYKTCRVCKAIYFNKAWHHGDRVNIEALKKNHLAWVTRCPACKMIENHQFEGLVTIQNIPARVSRGLLRLVKEYTGRAYEKDCQHRLIEVIKQDTKTWVITTTENQLANKLARKISESFDHVDVKVSYSPEPRNVVKVLVDFVPLFYHRFNFERG